MGKPSKSSLAKQPAAAEPKRRHVGKSPPDPVDVAKGKVVTPKPKPLCFDKKYQKVEKKPKTSRKDEKSNGKQVKKALEATTTRPSALRKPASASTPKETKNDEGKNKKVLDELKEKLE